MEPSPIRFMMDRKSFGLMRNMLVSSTKALIWSVFLAVGVGACSFASADPPRTLYTLAINGSNDAFRAGLFIYGPSAHYGTRIYAGDGAGSSRVAELEAQIRRTMAPGGSAAERERRRRVAEAVARPDDERALFGALAASTIRHWQRYQLGDNDLSDTAGLELHGAVWLLAQRKTRDPAALRLMLAYELHIDRPTREISEFEELLAAGRRWLARTPKLFELRAPVAMHLASAAEPRRWPLGDALVAALVKEYPDDLFVQILPFRVARTRFLYRGADLAEGRRAWALLGPAKRRVPAGSTFVEGRFRIMESTLRKGLIERGVKPEEL